MFNRLTIEISNLPDYEKLDLIRKMYEGVLSFETVCKSHGLLGKFKQHFDSIFHLNSMIESLSDKVNERSTHDNKASALLRNYCNLPISSRISQAQDLLKQIYQVAGKNSPVLNDLKKVEDQDQSLINAVNTFIELFTLSIYFVPVISTQEAKRVFDTLKTNPLANIATNNVDLKVAINQFQHYQETLSHCYCSPQRKADIQFLTGRFMEAQLNYYVPHINTIAFLLSINHKFEKLGFNKDIFGLFEAKPPKCVGKIKLLLNKLPETLLICDPEIEKHIATIKEVFVDIYQLAAKEAPKQTLRSKDLDNFWDTFFKEMQMINNQENIFTIQDAKFKASAAAAK